ncbi:MAG: hypothetical protein ABI891_09645 [Acidobacteriota bacterium]
MQTNLIKIESVKFMPEEFLAKHSLPADKKWKNGVPFTKAYGDFATWVIFL